jgi:hypothetical protein
MADEAAWATVLVFNVSNSFSSDYMKLSAIEATAKINIDEC